MNSNLYYKVEGSGDAIVFIHGLSDSLEYWEFLATNLKDDYRVIRYDLPGHGQSELDGKIAVDEYADDLINLLDELDVGGANLIGFSLGGAIALDFTLKCPKRVSSLVLMSSFAKADSHITSVFDKFRNALSIGFEEFYDLILPMVLCPDVIEDNREELEFLNHLTSQTANAQAYIRTIDAFLDFDLENELQKIEIPALILAGKYDEITSLDIQKNIQENIKGSELIIFDDVKHNLLVGKNNVKILDILKNFYEKRK